MRVDLLIKGRGLSPQTRDLCMHLIRLSIEQVLHSGLHLLWKIHVYVTAYIISVFDIIKLIIKFLHVIKQNNLIWLVHVPFLSRQGDIYIYMFCG